MGLDGGVEADDMKTGGARSGRWYVWRSGQNRCSGRKGDKMNVDTRGFTSLHVGRISQSSGEIGL